MGQKESRVQCHWCKDRMAPLKLSNMFVDGDMEIRVVCSQCIISSPNRDALKDYAPQPWTQRFTENSVTRTDEWGAVMLAASLIVAFTILVGTTITIAVIWRVGLG